MPYTVVKGDSLSKIAKRYKTTVAALLQLNEQFRANPDLIHPGQTVTLPEDETSVEEAPAVVEAPAVTAAAPGVLEGGQTVRVSAAAGDRYYQIYEFPAGSGQYVSYQFNSYEQASAALGTPRVVTRTEAWFNQHVVAEADAESVIGKQGSFAGLITEIIRESAVEAGVRDPSLVGVIASDPEMQQIMGLAVAGGWSSAQILAAQRNTRFWKETLYPGIGRLYGRTANPEGAWMQYSNNVTPALRALGYEPDADGTYSSRVGQMLGLGVDDAVFVSQAPVFIRASRNPGFASILNEWTRQELGRDVGFGEWFDLVAGEGLPELDAVAEKARLAYASEQAGTQFGVQHIASLADRTELSDVEAARVFTEVTEAVLALGDLGLKRGQLTREEVLAAAAGVNPDSGRSVTEVKEMVAKLAREEALFDDRKLNLFVGFDSAGRPYRPAATALTPERA